MLATKREAQAPLLSSSSDEDLNVCARPQDVSGSGSFYGSFPENPMQLRSRLCDENRASEMDLSAANEDLNTSDPRIAILDHDYRCPETINEFDGTWTTPSSPSESITSPVSNTSRSGAGLEKKQLISLILHYANKLIFGRLLSLGIAPGIFQSNLPQIL